jgi:hypothetical protein
MSITKLGTNDEAVNIDAVDRSLFRVRKTEPTKSGGLVTTFVYSSGANSDEVLAIVSANYDPKALDGFGQSRYSIRITSHFLETDDTTGERVIDQPIEAGVFINFPGQGIMSTALALSLLQNAWSLCYDQVASQEADETVMSDLGNFIPEIAPLNN